MKNTDEKKPKKQILMELLTLLFESKLRRYTEVTLMSWVQLLEKYPIEWLRTAIEAVIIEENTMISTADIIKKMRPDAIKAHNEKVVSSRKLLEDNREIIKKYCCHCKKDQDGDIFGYCIVCAKKLKDKEE